MSFEDFENKTNKKKKQVQSIIIRANGIIICSDSNIFSTLICDWLSLRGRNISICNWVSLHTCVLIHIHAERFSYSFAFLDTLALIIVLFPANIYYCAYIIQKPKKKKTVIFFLSSHSIFHTSVRKPSCTKISLYICGPTCIGLLERRDYIPFILGSLVNNQYIFVKRYYLLNHISNNTDIVSLQKTQVLHNHTK